MIHVNYAYSKICCSYSYPVASIISCQANCQNQIQIYSHENGRMVGIVFQDHNMCGYILYTLTQAWDKSIGITVAVTADKYMTIIFNV